MTPELLSLTLAALLQAVQLTLYATPANLEIGVRYTSSSRDAPLPKAPPLPCAPDRGSQLVEDVRCQSVYLRRASLQQSNDVPQQRSVPLRLRCTNTLWRQDRGSTHGTDRTLLQRAAESHGHSRRPDPLLLVLEPQWPTGPDGLAAEHLSLRLPCQCQLNRRRHRRRRWCLEQHWSGCRR